MCCGALEYTQCEMCRAGIMPIRKRNERRENFNSTDIDTSSTGYGIKVLNYTHTKASVEISGELMLG